VSTTELKVLYTHRKTILLVTVFTMLIAALFSLAMPLWFRAYTVIMPPQDEGSMFDFGSLLSDLPLQALGLGGASDQATLFMAMLRSRTVAEAVAEAFQLQTLYSAKNMEETLRELRRHYGVSLDDEGTLTLFAEARTPWFPLFHQSERDQARLLARDMANAFISELDRISKRLKSERAGNTRIFIETRYQMNIADLHRAEEAFKQFQKQYGTVALPEQTAATIAAASELKAQVIAKEIEMGVLEATSGSSHSAYLLAQKERQELEKRYQDFVRSRGSSPEFDSETDHGGDLFLSLGDVPDLGLQYARLYREVMIQEKIMTFLLPQYEQAKIQEAKDTPSVQILDEAVSPIRKHRPKRAVFILFFGFLACVISSTGFILRPAIAALYAELRN